MTPKAPLILENISHTFRDGGGVDGISMVLEPGQITGLLGPSGAGKSTLLRLIAGMQKLQAGRIMVGQRRLASATEHTRIEDRRIGLVFQDFALFPHLTAVENVAFGLRHLAKSARMETAKNWLRHFQLSARADAMPHQLSGGEQQRVAIARALAARPDAILLDEPFSGLDPALRDDVRQNALSEIRAAHIPALLVTHDPAEALAHCDNIAVLHQGKLSQIGAGETLYNHPSTLDVMQALGPVQRLTPEALPAPWRATLPSTAVFYSRPEAFIVTPNCPPLLTVKRLYSAGPTRFAEVSYEAETLTVIIPRGVTVTIDEVCGVTIDSDHIFAFDAK